MEIKDLGWANGWGKTPDIVKDCRDSREKGEDHDMQGHSGGRCVSVTTCNTCGYTYRIDSSD